MLAIILVDTTLAPQVQRRNHCAGCTRGVPVRRDARQQGSSCQLHDVPAYPVGLFNRCSKPTAQDITAAIAAVNVVRRNNAIVSG